MNHFDARWTLPEQQPCRRATDKASEDSRWCRTQRAAAGAKCSVTQHGTRMNAGARQVIAAYVRGGTTCGMRRGVHARDIGCPHALIVCMGGRVCACVGAEGGLCTALPTKSQGELAE